MKANELSQAIEPAGAPLRRPTHFSPPRILVVDEDSDLRLLYTEALVRPGYHVDAAEDGAAALKALRVNNYHLLITEHSLPTLTGVELVRTLRAARLALPVIMAAARLPVHELARNPSLQPVAVLPKPFYLSQLLETVRVVLRANDSPCGPIAPLPDWRSQPSARWFAVITIPLRSSVLSWPAMAPVLRRFPLSQHCPNLRVKVGRMKSLVG